MNVKPIGNNVLVKEVTREEKTSGGIVLTAKENNKTRYVEVVAVSPQIEKTSLTPGDVCIVPHHVGTSLGVDKLVLMDHSYFGCIVED